MWSARFWRRERQLECADTNMSTRVHTDTCTRQGHNLFFLFERGGWGLSQPGTSGITFCPLLLGALVLVICRWADTRHQAGCGREHSLTFVEVVLARKEGSLPSPAAGLCAQARRLWGQGLVSVRPSV